MLSTDTESQEGNKGGDGDDKAPELVGLQSRGSTDIQKVTLTTVHSAKGLEWPVVFIPAGESENS
jgi:superfamily I DNA/RNA helicase